MEILGSSLRREQVQRRARQLGKQHGLMMDTNLTGFQLREVQDVVDGAQQRAAGVADPIHIVAGQVRQVGLLGGQAREAKDAGQGRAQLVAHVGQEIGLHRRGGFRLGLGLTKLSLQRLARRDIPDDVVQAREPARDGIGGQGRSAFQPQVPSGLVLGPKLHRPGDDLAPGFKDRPAHVLDLAAVFRVHQRYEGAADQFLGREPGDGETGRGDIGHHAVQPALGDHIRGVDGEAAEPLLAFGYGRLGHLLLGHIDNGANDGGDPPVRSALNIGTARQES